MEGNFYFEPLCRPKPETYCIECCRIGCPLLTKLADGTKGCADHARSSIVNNNHSRLTKPGLCDEFSCIKLLGIPPDQVIKIHQLAEELPPGEFKASELIRKIQIDQV